MHKFRYTSFASIADPEIEAAIKEIEKKPGLSKEMKDQLKTILE